MVNVGRYTIHLVFGIGIILVHFLFPMICHRVLPESGSLWHMFLSLLKGTLDYFQHHLFMFNYATKLSLFEKSTIRMLFVGIHICYWDEWCNLSLKTWTCTILGSSYQKVSPWRVGAYTRGGTPTSYKLISEAITPRSRVTALVTRL